MSLRSSRILGSSSIQHLALGAEAEEALRHFFKVLLSSIDTTLFFSSILVSRSGLSPDIVTYRLYRFPLRYKNVGS